MARSFPIGVGLAVALLLGAMPQTAWAHHHGRKSSHAAGQTGSPPPQLDAAGAPRPHRAANGGGATQEGVRQGDARDAGSYRYDTKQGGNSSAPEHDRGTVSTPKSQPVDAGNAVDAHAFDNNPIDTRIAVQPRLSRSKDNRFHQSKTVFKLWPTRNKTASLKSWPKASEPDRRNAVGISVARRENVQGGDQDFALHRAGASTPNSDHKLAVVTPAPSAANRVTIRPQLNGAIALYRGALNGNDFTRPRYGSSVGGPAKPVAGINGSAFALKH